MSDSTFGFLLMVPALLVLLVVIAFPILKGIYASFCDYGLKELRKGIFDLKWNNFANYKIMLQNNQIFSYFKNTFVFVALVVVIQLILGMGIALLLNSKIKARGTLRGLMLVPWTIPSVVTAIVWRFMTNSSYGVINWIAYKLGMIPTLDYSWTLQSGSAMALIVIAAVWRQLPYMMVMILAGLQSVDKSLLEAGTIDGANYWQSLLHITIPSIRPVLITSIWIALMANFQMYTIIANITNGGPVGATTTLSIAAYNAAFQSYNFGYGAAIGVVWLIVLFIITMFSNKLTDKYSEDLGYGGKQYWKKDCQVCGHCNHSVRAVVPCLLDDQLLPASEQRYHERAAPVLPDQRDAEELLADLYPRVLSAVFPEQLHRLLRNDRDRAAGCGSCELRTVPL